MPNPIRFGGSNSEEINGLDGVIMYYGDNEDTQNYIKLLKAVRGLVIVGELFYLAPNGSQQEEASSQTLREMIGKFDENPEKVPPVIEALLALVIHLKNGGTYEEWFEGLD